MQTKEPVIPWLVSYGSSPRTRVRLFCFPYAGGAAHIFRLWPRGLPVSFDVSLVPGVPAALLATREDERGAVGWSLRELAAHPAYAAAVAVEGGCRRLRC